MFQRSLLVFDKDDVIYNGIKLPLTRQMIFYYVTQTRFHSEDLILYHYKIQISKLRDEQLNKILDDGEE